jgi:hypothetical protein
MSHPDDAAAGYTPARPTLVALALLTAWIVLLCLPMFAGKFLASTVGDQIYAGYPFRWFGAHEWHRTGGVPLWNPYIFGGLPFVGAGHGDIFYPTAFLRLLVPVDIGMNLGFAIHLVLAGFFTYLFLRSLEVSWTGSLVGGLGYQLSGIVASLVSPGHDGKLFVSALLPLALLGLVIAIRKRRVEGYAILALVVGLALVSPQTQMAEYMLIAAGLFTLYLTFWDERRPDASRRWVPLVLGLAAVVLGVAASMIQLLPFIHYMRYGARAAGAQGWAYATAYSMPPADILDWLISDFTGVLQRYWGENFFKLHSEYVGAAVLALAALGIGNARRRRLLWWAGGTGLLFLLVSLGAHTPFYRLWYEVVPGAKVTRAEGMAFYIVTFVLCVTAAFGVERLEGGGGGGGEEAANAPGRRLLYGLFVAAGIVLLLGASGGFGGLAASLAQPDRVELARANAGPVALSAMRAAVFMALAAGVVLLALRGRIRGPGLVLALAAVVGLDLFLNVRRFFEYSPRASVLYADDPVTVRLEATPKPYRLLDTGVYREVYLMAKEIPQVLGYHGNELNTYDQLMGGKNEWRYVGAPNVLNLTAVRYILLPAGQTIPGYHLALGPARTNQGETAYLLEADTIPPYARIVPAAVKVPDEQIVPTLLNPRLDPSRLLLLGNDAPVTPPRLDSMPPRSPVRATVTAWTPGSIHVRLDPAPDRDAYLLVSENWYPEWAATVDGRPAPLLRGDHTFITVPVARGAREVQLDYRRGEYRTGAAVSLASLAGIALWLFLPMAGRRRSA